MDYKSPDEWILSRLGVDKFNWNLSPSWRKGIISIPKSGICGHGHTLSQNTREIYQDDEVVCLQCRFSPGDIVLTISPFAGFVGVIQWSDNNNGASIRLLDDFRDDHYQVYEPKDWFWLIPTGKQEMDLSYEPENYWDAFVKLLEVPVFPPKKKSVGKKKKEKKLSVEEELAREIMKKFKNQSDLKNFLRVLQKGAE